MFGRMDSYRDILRVLLADGNHFFRQGLRDILETAGVTVVGEATTGGEAAALAGKLKPDVVVIDLNMPDLTDAAALRGVVTASPDARVVVLSSSAEETEVLEALQTGVCGYILKSAQTEELVRSIRQTADGQAVLSLEAMHVLVMRASSNNHAMTQLQTAMERPALTAREMDVLRLVVVGADNSTIGLELSISRHTVKQHITHIFEKLGVHSRVEAAVYAVRAGFA